MFKIGRNQARCKPKGECLKKMGCQRNTAKVYHNSVIIDETKNIVNKECMLFIEDEEYGEE